MSSCGNPEVEVDALMLRRQKFDKSKICVRCKQNPGNLVIRHAVYCKACFVPLVSIKFRRSLDPSINPLPDGPRRKGLKAGGNLLIGFSGGLGSTVLLDLIYRTYFSVNAPVDDVTGKPRGGKDHPRNANVWPGGAICYIETCNAFQGARNMTEEIRDVVAKYDRLRFIPLQLEDAFNDSWWNNIGCQPSFNHFGMDIYKEDIILFTMLSQVENMTPRSRLEAYISSLPTQTAITRSVQTLTRLLLCYTAMSINASHLLFGTSLTSLSISLISSIAQGGGFVVNEEVSEEWTPTIALPWEGNRNPNEAIRIVRPLRDIGAKECAMWAYWHGLHVVGRDEVPGSKHSIATLTKDFIVGLERDYPSTVSTIARTCGKLAPKQGDGSVCLLCERPAQYDIQEWRAQTSIRSFKDNSILETSDHLEDDIAGPKISAPSLNKYLCYSCYTTLTSRAGRGSNAATDRSEKPVPLPVWVAANLASSRTRHGRDVEHSDESQELWARRNMDDEQMKASIADFLLGQ